MKVVLVLENDEVRILEGEGTVSAQTLAMRSRLTSGDIKYFEFDCKEQPGTSLMGYIVALNQRPELLYTSKLIKPIE